MSVLSHLDTNGQASMVDVTDKAESVRIATAEGFVYLSESALAEVINQTNKKGDVLTTAKIAGIQAAKKCADLIPLCHPLALSKIEVNFAIEAENSRIYVTSLCKLTGKTGVEMEALTAVSVACLTLFDMCKSADPAMTIDGIRVTEKQGGKTGHWSPEATNNE